MANEKKKLLPSSFPKNFVISGNQSDDACRPFHCWYSCVILIYHSALVFFLQENELYYTQLLDVEYQRHPLNEEKILAVFDLVNASTLAADVKQKFYSRRYEFIDDLGSDVKR